MIQSLTLLHTITSNMEIAPISDLFGEGIINLSNFNQLKLLGGSLLIDRNSRLTELSFPQLKSVFGSDYTITNSKQLNCQKAQDLYDLLEVKPTLEEHSIFNNQDC